MSMTDGDESSTSSLSGVRSSAFMRVVRSGLRQLVRNARTGSFTNVAEMAVANADKSQQVMAHTESGPMMFSPAPFEKQTYTKGSILFVRPVGLDYQGQRTIPHAYNGITDQVSPEVVNATLTNLRNNNVNVATRAKLGSKASNNANNNSSNSSSNSLASSSASRARTRGRVRNQAAAILTALGIGPESQRTGQLKMYRAVLRRMHLDKSFSAKDAFTDKGAEGQPSFVQAAKGGKKQWRSLVKKSELPDHVEHTAGYLSASSDEEDRAPSLKRNRKLRVKDLSEEEQHNLYSILIDTPANARARVRGLNGRQAQFIQDHFPDLHDGAHAEGGGGGKAKVASARGPSLADDAKPSNKRAKREPP
jgi:hypothetical protein